MKRRLSVKLNDTEIAQAVEEWLVKHHPDVMHTSKIVEVQSTYVEAYLEEQGAIVARAEEPL